MAGPDQDLTALCQTLTTFVREQTELITSKPAERSLQEYHDEVLAKIPELTDEILGRYMLSHQRLQEVFGQFDMTESNERAFWSFFHDCLAKAKDTDPKDRNRGDIHFFYNVVKVWVSQSPALKTRLRKIVGKKSNKYPAPAITFDIAKPLLRSQQNAQTGAEALGARGICGGLDQHRLERFSIDELEAHLTSEIRTLEYIDGKLSVRQNPEYAYWHQHIRSAITKRICPEMTMAFFGSTGTGKSSLINALLGEKLVPQSSSRACTTFLTKLKYREAPDTSRRILITTHFIDHDSWACEVERYLSRYQTASSQEEKVGKDDNDFKIMRDKIRVFDADLARKSVSKIVKEELTEHAKVVQYLGQKDERYFSCTRDAYKALDALIKGCAGIESSASTNQSSYPWPLIKFVEVGVDNSVLKNGLSIVDLPGVQDSNKARSSIAEQSMRDCSAVYIVAPITRGSDCGSAVTLLLRAFQHEFHLDTLSLTWICTKSDDLTDTKEVAEEFEIEDKIDALQLRSDEIDSKKEFIVQKDQNLSNELRSVEDDLQVPKSILHTYRKLEQEILEGGTPLPPIFGYAGTKRKRDVSEDCKDMPIKDSDTEGFLTTQGHRLTTIADLDSCLDIDQVRSDFQSKSRIASELASQKEKLIEELRRLEDEQSTIKPQMWQMCIAARNEDVKTRVKASVAEALKQFQEDDPADQQHHGDRSSLSDHTIDEIAEGITVIMVSSKAYEYLSFKQHKFDSADSTPSIKSFTTYEQTGIPSLINHCTKQAEIKRRSHAVQLLNKIWKARNGLYLSISGRAFRNGVTEDDLQSTLLGIDALFAETSATLESEVGSLAERFSTSTNNMVLRKLPDACRTAGSQAPSVTESFGNSVKSASTYRAILKRDGVFTSGGFPYNFNSDLLQPLMNAIGKSWTKLFAEKLPEEVGRQQSFCFAPVRRLGKYVSEEAHKLGCSPKAINVLEEQFLRHWNEVEDASNSYHQNVQFEARAARGLLEGSIQKDLEPAYATSANITGKKSFLNMKRQMLHEVEQVKSTIFNAATKELRTKLKDSLTVCAKEHTDDVKETLEEMKHTYQSMFKLPEEKTSKDDLDFDQELLETLERDIQQESSGELKTIKKEVEALWHTESADDDEMFVD